MKAIRFITLGIALTLFCLAHADPIFTEPTDPPSFRLKQPPFEIVSARFGILLWDQERQ